MTALAIDRLSDARYNLADLRSSTAQGSGPMITEDRDGPSPESARDRAPCGEPARRRDRADSPAGPGRPEAASASPGSSRRDPWADVIRGADVHPLYPALVAMVEPPVSWIVGEGPGRLAARRAARRGAGRDLGVLVPVYFLTESLFDRRIAFIAAAVLALSCRVSPRSATRRSPIAWGCSPLSWRSGWPLGPARPAIGAARSARACSPALGYLARPEVILVPAVVAPDLAGRACDRPDVRVRAGSSRPR